MWADHPGEINTATNRVKLSLPRAGLIHAVPHCPDPELFKAETGRQLR